MKNEDRDSKFEVSYLTKQLCVIIKVSRDAFSDLDREDIQHLMKRVKRKLDKEQAAGRIDRYILSPETLERVWPILKKLVSESGDRDQFAIRFAFGVKQFDQVTVSSPESEEDYCEISIDASSDEIRRWNIVALSTYVNDVVHRNGWSDGFLDKESLKQACDYANDHRGEPIQLHRSATDDVGEIIKIHSVSSAFTPELKKLDASESAPENYPGKGFLQITVDPDGMAARIKQFSVRWYENAEIVFDESWLKKELRRLAIKSSTDEFIQRVKQKLVRHQDLNGLQIAAGIDGTAGTGPYLAVCIQDGSNSEQSTFNKPKSSIISCSKNSIVAEIRYTKPAVAGTDVFGKSVPAPPGEHLAVELGDGVESVAGQKFQATQDGLLKIDGLQISILKTYTCAGDINHNSGNIDFNGNIIVTGNVEVGASVKASGDITVEGNILGGSVICRGNLIVKGGISSAEKESVRCEGELKASFIERATIYVKCNINVETAIVQSVVHCGGDVVVLGSEGRIGASTVYLWGNLSTPKLGFATGAPTCVHLGEDWKEARQIRTWKSRFERISERLAKDKGEERTLKRLKKAQMTKKRLDMQGGLKEHIERLNVIAKKLELKLTRLNAVRKLNPTAKLKVAYEADGDVTFTLAGEPRKVASAA